MNSIIAQIRNQIPAEIMRNNPDLNRALVIAERDMYMLAHTTENLCNMAEQEYPMTVRASRGVLDRMGK